MNKDGDNHGDADNAINDTVIQVRMMISYLLIDDDAIVSLIWLSKVWWTADNNWLSIKLLLELIENPNTSIGIYIYMIELILIDKVSRMFTSK